MIDGTKANASKYKAMSYGRMREEEVRLSKEVDVHTRHMFQSIWIKPP
jgi:hypothetical protein